VTVEDGESEDFPMPTDENRRLDRD